MPQKGKDSLIREVVCHEFLWIFMLSVFFVYCSMRFWIKMFLFLFIPLEWDDGTLWLTLTPINDGVFKSKRHSLLIGIYSFLPFFSSRHSLLLDSSWVLKREETKTYSTENLVLEFYSLLESLSVSIKPSLFPCFRLPLIPSLPLIHSSLFIH